MTPSSSPTLPNTKCEPTIKGWLTLVFAGMTAIALVLAAAIFLGDYFSATHDIKTEAGARAMAEHLYKGDDIQVIRIVPFVEKEIQGKLYSVTKAEIATKNVFGTSIKDVVGLIVDKHAGFIYSLSEKEFEQFLETGDTSLLPAQKDLTVK